MSGTWAQLATLALALVCFGVGERLHGSGFVTAFTGGLAYAMVWPKSDAPAAMTQVSDAAGELLELTVFALFGAVVVVPAWRDVGWRVVLFAVLALFVVRVASVAIALVGSGLPTRSTLFMGWFGPRGIGTLVLGLIVIERGELHEGALITQAVVVTVTLSLVVHSLAAPLGVRLCQQNDTSADSPSPTRANDIPRTDRRPKGRPDEKGGTAQE
jgi:sodium/hydrogen antiporter